MNMPQQGGEECEALRGWRKNNMEVRPGIERRKKTERATHGDYHVEFRLEARDGTEIFTPDMRLSLPAGHSGVFVSATEIQR